MTCTGLVPVIGTGQNRWTLPRKDQRTVGTKAVQVAINLELRNVRKELYNETLSACK